MVRSRAVGYILCLSLALFLILGLTIGCGSLYWHFKLSRATASFKKTEDVPSSAILYEGRARAIPYLVDAVNPSCTRRQLYVISGRLSVQVGSLEDIGLDANFGDRSIPIILETDQPTEIQRKCAAIQEWWRMSSKRYPPRWQFWDGEKLR